MQFSGRLIRRCTITFITGLVLSGLTSDLALSFSTVMGEHDPINLTSSFKQRIARRIRPSRGDCPRVAIPLTSLVDADDETRSNLTNSARPIFWLYFPYTIVPNPSKGELAAGTPMRLVIKNVQDEENPQTIVTIDFKARNTAPGVIRIPLPESVPALMSNTNYVWYFHVFCDGSDSPETVQSWIRRQALAPTLAERIAKARPSDRPQIYLENGFGYDGIDTLASLLQQDPTNRVLRSQWQEVLRRYGLRELENQPIVEFTLDEVQIKLP